MSIPRSKIVVAMSGGIDSSTVAGLLHEQGHEVIGITLQLYDYNEMTTYGSSTKKNTCCAGQDIYDAKLASEHIGIPHYVFNYESKFKQKVIDNFVDSYLHGETPVPCVQCNMSVKFTDLIRAAKELEADFLATGHYVQKIYNKLTQKNEMHRGRDLNKDQSYFLFQTTRNQLDYLLFPLGNMTKDQTRNEAKRLGLEIYNKPESQDICFVPNGNYAKVIEKYRPEALNIGLILHVDGFELGKHNGIHQFTIGQRKGLGVSYAHPLYVIRIDPLKNIVYVGTEDHLIKTVFKIKGLNLLEELDEDKNYLIKIRSLHNGGYARIKKLKNKSLQEDDLGQDEIYQVELLESQRAVTPGQPCVIYDGNKMIGGGWIIRET